MTSAVSSVLNHLVKMAQKLSGGKNVVNDRDKDVINDNIPASATDQLTHNHEGFLPFVSSMLVCCSPRRSKGAVRRFLTDSSFETSCDSDSESEKIPECPVCLQTCIHPVQLPCSHIFCFLCVKGVANQSKRCALCRQEIPIDFLNNPSLVRRQDLRKDTGFEDGFQWYYEGRNGWWQYDQRTSNELEDRLKRDIKAFEILIAGFLYVIDLETMVQVRRNDPTRRRRIKRDLATIPKKGVAGLKFSPEGSDVEETPTTVRVGAEGDDTEGNVDGDGTRPPDNNHLHPSAVDQNQPLLNTMSNLTVTGTQSGSPSAGGYAGSPHRSSSGGPASRERSPSPCAPRNTPQSPENNGSPNTPESPTTEELNRNLEELALTPSGRYKHLRRHRRHRHRNYDRHGRPRIRLLDTSSSSSDSDWD